MTAIRDRAIVALEDLRWRLDPAALPFTTTDELEAQEEIIGQDRGVEAFRFGMGMDAKGYNIFVTGSVNLGKMAVVKRLLENYTRKQETPDDLCYVNNFKTQEEPILLRFVAGNGVKFKTAVDKFLEGIKREVPQLFESQEYINSKNAIIEEHDKKTREFFKGLEERVKDAGFVMVNMQMGQIQRPDIVPVIDGEPVHLLKLEEMMEKGRFPREEFEQLRAKYKELKEDIDAIFLEVRTLQKEVKHRSEEVDKLMFMNIARELSEPLLNGWRDAEKVQKHVEAMLDDMAENLDAIKSIGQPQQGPMGMSFPGSSAETVLHPYGVNLLVDNSESEGPPVIVESHPTYRNLFGSIERVMDRNGLWRTDYKKINGGSFIRANGGYLVINLMDAIQEAGVWQTLKRALKTSEIEIQTFDPYYLMATSSLKPESISMEVKVVVIATPHLYHLLRNYDEDVDKIFKVRADFEASMPRDDKAVRDISRLIRTFVNEGKLMPFHADAVASLLEHGVRISGRQERISTAFPILSDIMEEANFIAREAGESVVRGEHICKANDARIYRTNQMEDRLQEMIDRGSVFIDTEGAVVGQINGLAVYSLGDYAFGKPARITCATSIGKEGIINIEREADLSGSTHSKGMLILGGYLRKYFAQDKPLTLAASIAFEQSYGGIDGDSASSTELYALLSSLAEVPIHQGIAVTGSVNQKGEVQPIGGVNEKIEGFFKVCKNRGLTGEQGVMIPKANVKDLMLKEEVVEAVKNGTFHIWAVAHVNEGIEILTGRSAGERDEAGRYPEGSINALVDEKLRSLAEGLRDFAKAKYGGGENGTDNDENNAE